MNNLRTPPLSSCKNLPPYFFMVHLLHRLYGVDAPGAIAAAVPPRPQDGTACFSHRTLHHSVQLCDRL